MRGELDTERGDNVRSEPEADAQGRPRYQRAGFVHAAARAVDPDTTWQLIDVAGAEHDQKAMAAAAQRFLLAPTPPLSRTCPLPDGDPCPVPAHTLPKVKRILLTGMSGTGKSAVIRELLARGYKAVDTDDGWCEPQADGRQMWREDAIQTLLSTEDAEVLFVAGCEENQAKFHPQFDHIILLSAGRDSGRAVGDTDQQPVWQGAQGVPSFP